MNGVAEVSYGMFSNTNWHTMLYLIRNAIQLCENSPPEVADELLRRTIHIFRDLANSDKKERGYLLGLLEISKIKSLSSASLIIEYFDTFGSKMCFFDDVRPYLQGLLSNPGLPIPVFEHVDTFIMNHQALVSLPLSAFSPKLLIPSRLCRVRITFKNISVLQSYIGTCEE